VQNEDNISVSASASGGFGGSITLNAGNGVLTMAQGTLSVDAVGGLTVATPGPVIVEQQLITAVAAFQLLATIVISAVAQSTYLQVVLPIPIPIPIQSLVLLVALWTNNLARVFHRSYRC